ncbi:hypothetical protein YC2023_016995 [Brassica napus]
MSIVPSSSSTTLSGGWIELPPQLVLVGCPHRKGLPVKLCESKVLNCLPCGMAPDKLLNETLKTARLLSSDSCEGIWPCNLLEERSRLSTFFRPDKLFGINPDSLLCERLRACSSIRAPRSAGISPLSSFFEISIPNNNWRFSPMKESYRCFIANSILVRVDLAKKPALNGSSPRRELKYLPTPFVEVESCSRS